MTEADVGIESPLPREREVDRAAGGARATRAARRRDPLRRRLLAFSDALTALLAVGALALFSGGVAPLAWGATVVPVWILLAKVHGLYDRDHMTLRHVTADELSSIFAWSLSGTGATALVLLATPTVDPGLNGVVASFVVAGSSAFPLRAAARLLWRQVVPPEQAVVVGSGPLARAARRKLDLFPDIHIAVRRTADESSLADITGNSGWLNDVDRVVLASTTITEDLLAELLRECRRRGVKLSVVPPARGMFGTAVQLNHVADLPVIAYNTWPVSRSTLLLKRVLDVFVSATALVLLASLLMLVALAVKLDSRGPALFRQRRAGKGGKPFAMHKFRTMVPDAEERLRELVAFEELDEPVFKLASDPRVTRVGRFLRRWSLDELPQLVDVLRGHMSLVGPRPEQVELVEHYEPQHLFRLAVKPGVTGPMQVFGRGALSFEERLAVERDYVENLSLGRDLKILFLTIGAVISGRGAT